MRSLSVTNNKALNIAILLEAVAGSAPSQEARIVGIDLIITLGREGEGKLFVMLLDYELVPPTNLNPECKPE